MSERINRSQRTKQVLTCRCLKDKQWQTGAERVEAMQVWHPLSPITHCPGHKPLPSTGRKVRTAALVWNFFHGPQSLNFMSFSHVMEYYSNSDFFPSFTNGKNSSQLNSHMKEMHGQVVDLWPRMGQSKVPENPEPCGRREVGSCIYPRFLPQWQASLLAA